MEKNATIYNGSERSIDGKPGSAITKSARLLREEAELHVKTPSVLQRLISFESELASTRANEELRDRFEQVLKTLRKTGDAKYFLHPVDLKMYPHYKTICPRPMDLNKILNRVRDNLYADVKFLVRDLELIASNSVAFNGPNHEISMAAQRLVETAKRELNQWYAPSSWIGTGGGSTPSGFSSYRGNVAGRSPGQLQFGSGGGGGASAQFDFGALPLPLPDINSFGGPMPALPDPNSLFASLPLPPLPPVPPPGTAGAVASGGALPLPIPSLPAIPMPLANTSGAPPPPPPQSLYPQPAPSLYPQPAAPMMGASNTPSFAVPAPSPPPSVLRPASTQPMQSPPPTADYHSYTPRSAGVVLSVAGPDSAAPNAPAPPARANSSAPPPTAASAADVAAAAAAANPQPAAPTDAMDLMDSGDLMTSESDLAFAAGLLSGAPGGSLPPTDEFSH